MSDKLSAERKPERRKEYFDEIVKEKLEKKFDLEKSLENVELAVNDGDEITPFQSRWVDEYMVDMNESRASERLTGDPWSAWEMGKRMLKHPLVKAEIKNRQQEYREKSAITVDRVLDEIGKIAFLNAKGAFDENGWIKNVHEIPDEIFEALSSIDIEKRYEGRGDDQEEVKVAKIRTSDKLGALSQLAKYLGMNQKDNKLQLEIGLQAVLGVLPAEIRPKVIEEIQKRLQNK